MNNYQLGWKHFQDPVALARFACLEAAAQFYDALRGLNDRLDQRLSFRVPPALSPEVEQAVAQDFADREHCQSPTCDCHTH